MPRGCDTTFVKSVESPGFYRIPCPQILFKREPIGCPVEYLNPRKCSNPPSHFSTQLPDLFTNHSATRHLTKKGKLRPRDRHSSDRVRKHGNSTTLVCVLSIGRSPDKAWKSSWEPVCFYMTRSQSFLANYQHFMPIDSFRYDSMCCGASRDSD